MANEPTLWDNPWPIIAEREAAKAELRKLPWYGGNKIPDSYLARFMTAKPDEVELPADIGLFVDDL